jgi:UDP-3-O-[3-hydroxymyristoyl] glucosamine N-acyltransferase
MSSIRTTPDALAHLLGGEVVGDRQLELTHLRSLESADPGSISFLAQARFLPALRASDAGCVLISPDLRDEVSGRRSAVLVDQPYLAYARLSQWWAAQRRDLQAGVHPSAVISPDAHLADDVFVGPGAVIDAGAVLASGVRIGPQVWVGARVNIGERTDIRSGVRIAADSQIGRDVLIHPGVVIGADGFGFAPSPQGWVKIEQLGRVVIGDRVEIGANTCIDRGALDDTVIEEGVKLDNLIQVGHNVRIGAHSAMAGCVGIAGSARIGKGCTVGGGAIILGHLELVDGVHITAATLVTRSIRSPGQYSGAYPFESNRDWEKNAATLRSLHSLRDRLRALEKQMEKTQS